MLNDVQNAMKLFNSLPKRGINHNTQFQKLISNYSDVIAAFRDMLSEDPTPPTYKFNQVLSSIKRRKSLKIIVMLLIHKTK